MNGQSGWGKWVAGRRSRWVTLLVWIAAAGLLTALLPAVGDEETNNAPNLSASSLSVEAKAVAEREFPSDSGVPALLVWHAEAGLSDEALGNIQKFIALLSAEPVHHQSFVPPLHELPLPAIKAQLSANGGTLVTPVFFEAGADTEQMSEGIDELQAKAEAHFGFDPFAGELDGGDRFSARITGPVGIQIDATGLFQNADFALMVGTVLLVLILLLLIYRSPVLALIPLVAVGFAYGVISPILGWMAHEGWIVVDSQAIAIMTVLLFGAGTDYCLFLIARFRQLLRFESDKGKALLSAITGSSGAIAMSGLTVVLSLLALLVAEYGAYHRFAAPFSIAILIMGIASLTLVPALLAIIGRASFYPFVPRTQEMREERARRKGKPAPTPEREPRNRIGRFVVAKPWTIVLSCVILLGGLAAIVPQIRTTYDILSSFPANMPSREGFAIIGEEFSPGELAPVTVMADTEGKTVDLQVALSGLTFLDDVAEQPQTGKENPNIQAFEALFNVNPYAMEAMDRIPDLRAAAITALEAAGISDAADKVWVGGQTADQYDTRQVGERDTRLIIPIVIGLITLLLLAYLRSITATVYLVLTVILSYFSALGLGWLVIHYGLGADAIQGSIPLYSFVFLVALGEDYNIFMISSIWSKSKKMPLKQAIREGVGETGSVITSAGLILAGTFAVLASLPIQVLVQFGIITAIGVLLDTFVVRPFLVPAITMLLGRRAFWPGKHTPIEESTAKAAN